MGIAVRTYLVSITILIVGEVILCGSSHGAQDKSSHSSGSARRIPVRSDFKSTGGRGVRGSRSVTGDGDGNSVPQADVNGLVGTIQGYI